VGLVAHHCHAQRSNSMNPGHRWATEVRPTRTA
jgi:hypothetical protein